MKYKKQFEKEHPECIGETDGHFYMSNYVDWLEKRLASIGGRIKSARLCMQAHPDNEEGSEFADRVDDLIEIEEFLKQNRDERK